jgi:hypothetical protein
MAIPEPRRNIRQELLNCLRGELPGWNRHTAPITSFAEVEAVASLREILEADEVADFDAAFKELLTDSGLSVDELGTLVYYAVTESYVPAEPEIRVLRSRSIVTGNQGLRDLVEGYIAYREYDKNLHRSSYQLDRPLERSI